jgi:hypothetical protein
MIRESAKGLKFAQREIAGLPLGMAMLFLLAAGVVAALTKTISPSVSGKVRAPASGAR